MESVKIKGLLEVYFEGETSLEQEAVLREYFTSGDVAPELENYVGMFSAFAKAQKETLPAPIKIPNRGSWMRWTAVAAVAAVAIVAIGLFFQNPSGEGDFNTYKDPEVAAMKARQALFMLSNAMNTGTQQLEFAREFENVQEEYFK